MTEDTTTQQLAEIEGQPTDYTPPEGWRLLEVGEEVDIPGRDQYVIGPNRYIRPIEPQPEEQPEPQADTVQVREGRWRTRNGEIRHVTPTPEARNLLNKSSYSWYDAHYNQTWLPSGRYHLAGDSPFDLLEYLGPIEPDKTQELETKTQELPAEYTPPEGWRVLAVGEALREGDVTVRKDGYCYPTERVGGWVGANQRYIRPIEPEPRPEPEPEVEPDAATIEELRSEVSYVQNLLGESRQRVTQLESLVANLRTINAAQEKAVDAAGKENTALQRELAVAKEELTIAAAVSQQLQIELDAAQQVPADSPELQQLRLRLADMTLDRDQCKNAYDQIFADLVTIRETTAAETVEAIIEWLQPFRGCNSPALALLLLEALPHIMRSLTGLADEEIE